MRPQFRCVLSPNACPAAGQVVLLDDDETTRNADCPVCGRPLTFQGVKQDGVTGRMLARTPNHRRLDAEFKAQQQTRSTKIFALAAVQERAARQAARRSPRRALPLVRKAMATVGQLGDSGRTRARWQSLQRLAARLARLDPANRVKRSARWQVLQILNASDIDPSAIDPGFDRARKDSRWTDHLGQVLRPGVVRKLLAVDPYKMIEAGLIALAKHLDAKAWSDFEAPRFLGSQSFLAFVQEFNQRDDDPPFARLRLPDAYYAWRAEQRDEALNARMMAGDSGALDDLPF